jgi:rhamnulokinase
VSAAPALPRDPRALVALDLGAESCRVSLLRQVEDQLSITLVLRFANGPVSAPSGLHWPLASIEQRVLDGLRLCAAIAPEGIRSIAVDGWAVDYVRLNDEGGPASPPFCYRDDRTLGAEESIHAHLAVADLRALTGIQIQRINTAYQLVADRMAGTAPARWLNLPEYLLYRLGGSPVAELTNASHTQLIEQGCACWSQQAFHLLGLDPAQAARIVNPGTIVGRFKGELADLPAFRDTVLIAPACHDTASAIAGIPVEEDVGDWAYISSGTWSLVGTVLDAPENGARARAGNYTNLAAVGGKTLFHKGLNGMWLLRQCLQHWSVEGGQQLDLQALIAEAARLDAPQDLLQLDDPELLLHGDMPRRISRQVARDGGRIQLPTNAPATYANLIFHSLAARYAGVLEEIAAITSRQFQRIYIVGGGSQNLYLNGLIEKATGIEVLRGPAEASTHGNLAVQLAVLEDGKASMANVLRWTRALQRRSLR